MTRPAGDGSAAEAPGGKLATLAYETHITVPRPYFRAVLTLNYCYFACILIHLFLIPLFVWIGETGLALFNVGSVVLFAVCLYLNAWRGVYRLPVLLATAEILVHASIAVIIFGWDAGFHYYVLALGVSTFIIPWWSVAGKLGLVALVALVSVALRLYSRAHEPLTLLDPDVIQLLYLANLLTLFGSLGLIGFAVSRSAVRAEENLDVERRRSEELLHNILPIVIAERLKSSPAVIADRFEEVTILFCDLVGFTPMSEAAPAEEVVSLLNRIFSAFDVLADEHGLEKIKTIGDAYMVAGGLPRPRADHAALVADFALAIRARLAEIEVETGRSLSARIGLHSGTVIAGVIGSRKFAYDVWGDTVNTASRMESQGKPGEIQLTEETRLLLGDDFVCDERGLLDIKGKGAMRTFWLRDRRHDESAPAQPVL